MSKVEQRRKHARIMVWFWFAQVPIAAGLYAASLVWPAAKDLLIPYLIGISVETGIESALARKNADLPS